MHREWKFAFTVLILAIFILIGALSAFSPERYIRLYRRIAVGITRREASNGRITSGGFKGVVSALRFFALGYSGS
jgi:hypothetical protein